MKLFKSISAAAGLTMALAAGSASAIPITGSVSLSDGLVSSTYSLSLVHIVGSVNKIVFQPLGNGSGGLMDFAGSNGTGNVTTNDITTLVPLSTVNPTWVVDGFSFVITSLTFGPVDVPPFICGSATCSDGLTMSLTGTVSKIGFDPTEFTGTLALTGTCIKDPSASRCSTPDITKSGSWNASLSAAGVPVVTPEPVSVSLIGLGLLGMAGVARRRRQAA